MGVSLRKYGVCMGQIMPRRWIEARKSERKSLRKVRKRAHLTLLRAQKCEMRAGWARKSARQPVKKF